MKPDERPAKKGASKSFFKTVLLSLLAVTLLITLLLDIFLTANYVKTSLSQAEQYNQNLLAQTNYAITQMDENSQRLTNSLFGNKDIISYLYMKKSDNTIPVLAGKTLDNQLLTLPYVESIYLYNAKLDLFYSSKTGEQQSSDSFSDQEIARLVENGQSDPEYTGNPAATKIDPSGQNARTLTYVLYDAPLSQNTRRNALVINVHSYILTDSIRSINTCSESPDMNYIVLDSDGTLLSSVLRPELASEESLLSVLDQCAPPNIDLENTYLKIGGTGYLQACTNQNKYGWYIISLVPTASLLTGILFSALIGGIIAIAVFLFCSAVCLILARKLNSPLQTITSLIRGEVSDITSANLPQAEEFRCILSVFDSMKNQNAQLDKLKRETAYTLRQDCLNSLLSGNSTKSPQQIRELLQRQELLWILDHPLCMCVLKIDCYSSFLEKNDPKEYWILRFAVVNISEELSAARFSSCVFSRNNDKFVLLIDCNDVADYAGFQKNLESLISEIQKNVLSCMDLSLSAAYSTIFKDAEQLSSMYRNMKDSLLLKLRYGHGSVISPYMADELDTDPFQLPANRANQLLTSITAGNEEDALTCYRQIAALQQSGSYTEIISGSIHLLYSIYSGLLPKYQALNESLTASMQDALEQLHESEIWTDITELLESFIEECCRQVREQKRNCSAQNTNAIPSRIRKIIEREYQNQSLCLSSIAADIGFSPNYIGQMFKTATGKSVAQYILDYRMEKLAAYLDDGNQPLHVILEKVGIEKSNYFYTQFKKHFGMSLGEYRLHHSKEEFSQSDS